MVEPSSDCATSTSTLVGSWPPSASRPSTFCLRSASGAVVGSSSFLAILAKTWAVSRLEFRGCGHWGVSSPPCAICRRLALVTRKVELKDGQGLDNVYSGRSHGKANVHF